MHRFWSSALVHALILGLCEAAFIFTARQGMTGSGYFVIPILGALVVGRFLLQLSLVSLETSTAANRVSAIREMILSSLQNHAVPAYRPAIRRTLIHALQETAPRIGEGFLAQSRFYAAVLQAGVLIPCLLLLSWRLALLFLPLALTAYSVTRWRTRRMRSMERAQADSEMEGRRVLEDFGENLETVLSGSVPDSTRELTHTFSQVQNSEIAWRRAQAHYPALMELFFFFALTALISVAQRFSIPQGWDAWMVFSGLLLLAYRPVREAARYYPQKLVGAQAMTDIEKRVKEWNAFPSRTLPDLSSGPHLILEKIDFGYDPRNSSMETGVLVFRDYSATFDFNSLTGIVGPNGAGKTTLLRLLAGVETPQVGKVLWPESLRAHGRIAYLPQRIFLDRNYGAWAEAMAVRDPEFWNHLDSLLGISRLLRTGFHPENLSGGEKQRLALARVLVSNAPFLLLDEPTSAIPGHEREAVLTGALNLWKHRTGAPRGALIVSHESFLQNCCDSIYSMHPVTTTERIPA